MRKILFALLISGAAVFALSSGASAQTINEVWANTKNTNSVAILEAFIEIYPDSIYAQLAKARIKELRSQSKKKMAPDIVSQPASTPPSSAPITSPPPKSPTSPKSRPSKVESLLPKKESAPSNYKSPLSKNEIYHQVFDNDPDLIRTIQEELKKQRCYTGKVDGVWGQGSRKAIAAFGRHAGVKIGDKPSEALLTKVREVAGPVCPRN